MAKKAYVYDGTQWVDIAQSVTDLTAYAPKANPSFTGTVTLAANAVPGINANNSVINNVGQLEFGDPGVGEGIQWAGGNLWKIYESPDALTNAAGNLQFVQNATRRMTIDTGGRITMPSQPYFHVRSTQATAIGSDVLWTTIDSNSGSYYNSTNGRFTAPVSGTYFFSAHGLYSNADAADMRVGLYKNNGEVQGNRFIVTKGAAVWQTFYANDIIYLAANDYVTVRYIQGAGALHTDVNYNGFRGWLLG